MTLSREHKYGSVVGPWNNRLQFMEQPTRTKSSLYVIPGHELIQIHSAIMEWTNTLTHSKTFLFIILVSVWQFVYICNTPNTNSVGQHLIPNVSHVQLSASFTTGCWMLYLWTAASTLLEFFSLMNLAQWTPIWKHNLHSTLKSIKLIDWMHNAVVYNTSTCGFARDTV